MPTLISFSGLSGVGKTTIASALAREIQALYVRVDSIEAALKNSSLKIHPAEDAGYFAAIAVAKDNLAHGFDVVADTVNPLGLTRRWWADAATSSNAKLLNVEVVCSDQTEHRRRVELLGSDLDGYVSPDWDRVQGRHFEQWMEKRLTLDTGRLSVVDCVVKIIQALAADH
jgi:predicted kinase